MGFWRGLHAGLLAAAQEYSTTPPVQQYVMAYPWPIDPRTSHISALGQLQCRLAIGAFSPNANFNSSEEPQPYSHLEAVRTKDNVVVFVVTKAGAPVTIIDDLTLFPSDQLITQLRLLEQT